MESLIFLLSVLGIHLLGAASPGPDFFLITKNALQYSRKAGIYTAFGLACGVMVHVTYCILGIAVIISKSLLLFGLIKYLGACYLLYLGWRALCAPKQKFGRNELLQNSEISSWRCFRMGFLTNILNPKVTLFFLSLFTVFIPADTPFWLLITSMAGVVISTFGWFVLVSCCITIAPIKRIYQKWNHLIMKGFGALLMLFGVRVMFSGQK